mgnify:CR=1 FL=1
MFFSSPIPLFFHKLSLCIFLVHPSSSEALSLAEGQDLEPGSPPPRERAVIVDGEDGGRRRGRRVRFAEGGEVLVDSPTTVAALERAVLEEV